MLKLSDQSVVKKKQQMGSITAPWIGVAIPTPSQS